jgi:hypothetical protein
VQLKEKEHQISRLNEQLHNATETHDKRDSSKRIELLELRKSNELLDQEKAKIHLEKLNHLMHQYATDKETMNREHQIEIKTIRETYRVQHEKTAVQLTATLKKRHAFEMDLLNARLEEKQNEINELMKEKQQETDKTIKQQETMLKEFDVQKKEIKASIVARLSLIHSQEIKDINGEIKDIQERCTKQKSASLLLLKERCEDIHALYNKQMSQINVNHENATATLQSTLIAERHEHHLHQLKHAEELSILNDQIAVDGVKNVNVLKESQLNISTLENALLVERKKCSDVRHRLDMIEHHAINRNDNEGHKRHKGEVDSPLHTSLPLLQQQLLTLTQASLRDQERYDELVQTNQLEIQRLRQQIATNTTDCKNTLMQKEMDFENIALQLKQHIRDLVENRDESLQRSMSMERREMVVLQDRIRKKEIDVIKLKETIRHMSNDLIDAKKNFIDTIQMTNQKWNNKYNNVLQERDTMRKAFDVAVACEKNNIAYLNAGSPAALSPPLALVSPVSTSQFAKSLVLTPCVLTPRRSVQGNRHGEGTNIRSEGRAGQEDIWF